MTAMIPVDVMNAAEIEEAERDAWYDSICPDCGHPGRDHDDGECPPRTSPDWRDPWLVWHLAVHRDTRQDSGKVSEPPPRHAG
jgi:hypothetical protein